MVRAAAILRATPADAMRASPPRRHRVTLVLVVDSPGAEEILKRHATALAQPLTRAVERATDAPAKLRESILYSLTAGGKRLRPGLVLECCLACGGSAGNASTVAAAVALEL